MSLSHILKTVSLSCLAIISCSFSSIAQTVAPSPIKLTYFASQIQCGAGGSMINVEVDVFQNQQLVQTLSLNDSIYLSINSFDDLSFEYNFIDAECSPATPTEMTLAPEDTVPDLPGAYDQDSIQDMLSDLKKYEELFLVELGTTDTESSAYDLQDTVMIINNNPYID